MVTPDNHHWQIEQRGSDLWLARFESMKSPCEIWLEGNRQDVVQAFNSAVSQCKRIEYTYSRFRKDSYLSRINKNAGTEQLLNQEASSLLHFADQVWHVTEGLIDITIGAYLQHWRFDGHTPAPTMPTIRRASTFVGWDKVILKGNRLMLPKGMQLDLGGIGKEYAVDSVAKQLASIMPTGGILVNFGGDIMAKREKNNHKPWKIGVERLHSSSSIEKCFSISQGAIATSGNNKRFAVDSKGQILGHILNPKTGMPVAHGPASVTVVAETATQAGLLSTCAMLKGKDAKAFLHKEQVPFIIQNAAGNNHHCDRYSAHETAQAS